MFSSVGLQVTAVVVVLSFCSIFSGKTVLADSRNWYIWVVAVRVISIFILLIVLAQRVFLNVSFPFC